MMYERLGQKNNSVKGAQYYCIIKIINYTSGGKESGKGGRVVARSNICDKLRSG